MALLCINGIMLLNLIIAIMSNTYEELKNNSFGLYYDGIIEAMPVFKNDRRYGALIATVPPFNLLVVFFMPFFIACQDEKLLEYVNDFLQKIFFFPIAILGMIAITVFNLVMLPFAFLYALAHKCILFFKKRNFESGLELILFTLCGMFFLLLALVPDAFKYFQQAYSTDVIRVQQTRFAHKFSYESFVFFREKVETARVEKNIKASDLVEDMNAKFGVSANIE